MALDRLRQGAHRNAAAGAAPVVRMSSSRSAPSTTLPFNHGRLCSPQRGRKTHWKGFSGGGFCRHNSYRHRLKSSHVVLNVHSRRTPRSHPPSARARDRRAGNAGRAPATAAAPLDGRAQGPACARPPLHLRAMRADAGSGLTAQDEIYRSARLSPRLRIRVKRAARMSGTPHGTSSLAPVAQTTASGYKQQFGIVVSSVGRLPLSHHEAGA
jgi:hypothetical protein